MFLDLLGNKRMKINLHTHTTASDGRKTPEEAARIYREAGYDAVALTDHWHYRESGMLEGIRILGGAEYDAGKDSATGIFHIVALGCRNVPKLTRADTVQDILDGIRKEEGLAVLAHPAWSLNTVSQISALKGVEAVEIYNTVSEAGESDRAYSGHFVDAAGSRGFAPPLFASDDTHYYDGSDETKASIMLECEPDADDPALLRAIREKRFYATLGPEVHLIPKDNGFQVLCSPAVKIALFSNLVWVSGHILRGEGLTETFYVPKEGERFLRAEVTDARGRRAWTNIVELG